MDIFKEYYIKLENLIDYIIYINHPRINYQYIRYLEWSLIERYRKAQIITQEDFHNIYLSYNALRDHFNCVINL